MLLTMVIAPHREVKAFRFAVRTVSSEGRHPTVSRRAKL